MREVSISGLHLRTLALAVTAVAASLSAGRLALRQGVQRSKQSLIDQAFKRARLQVKSEAETYIKDSLRTFLCRTLLKAAALGLVTFLVLLLGLERELSWFLIASCLSAFLVWDAFNVFPTLRILTEHLSANQFRPKRALSSAVAANVLAQVVSRMRAEQISRSQTLLLAAAGTSESDFKNEIADAVSTLAGEASWKDLKPFILFAGCKVLSVLILYSAYVWLTVSQIS